MRETVLFEPPIRYERQRSEQQFQPRIVVNANTATLKYEANYELDAYDSVGSASYNYSRLGNNGLDRTLTCIWPDDAKGMKGFSGHKFTFRFNDGTIITSHNVWHQGNIAEADPYWQGLFPDNAIIITDN